MEQNIIVIPLYVPGTNQYCSTARIRRMDGNADVDIRKSPKTEAALEYFLLTDNGIRAVHARTHTAPLRRNDVLYGISAMDSNGTCLCAGTIKGYEKMFTESLVRLRLCLASPSPEALQACTAAGQAVHGKENGAAPVQASPEPAPDAVPVMKESTELVTEYASSEPITDAIPVMKENVEPFIEYASSESESDAMPVMKEDAGLFTGYAFSEPVLDTIPVMKESMGPFTEYASSGPVPNAIPVGKQSAELFTEYASSEPVPNAVPVMNENTELSAEYPSSDPAADAVPVTKENVSSPAVCVSSVQAIDVTPVIHDNMEPPVVYASSVKTMDTAPVIKDTAPFFAPSSSEQVMDAVPVINENTEPASMQPSSVETMDTTPVMQNAAPFVVPSLSEAAPDSVPILQENMEPPVMQAASVQTMDAAPVMETASPSEYASLDPGDKTVSYMEEGADPFAVFASAGQLQDTTPVMENVEGYPPASADISTKETPVFSQPEPDGTVIAPSTRYKAVLGQEPQPQQISPVGNFVNTEEAATPVLNTWQRPKEDMGDMPVSSIFQNGMTPGGQNSQFTPPKRDNMPFSAGQNMPARPGEGWEIIREFHAPENMTPEPQPFEKTPKGRTSVSDDPDVWSVFAASRPGYEGVPMPAAAERPPTPTPPAPSGPATPPSGGRPPVTSPGYRPTTPPTQPSSGGRPPMTSPGYRPTTPPTQPSSGGRPPVTSPGYRPLTPPPPAPPCPPERQQQSQRHENPFAHQFPGSSWMRIQQSDGTYYLEGRMRRGPDMIIITAVPGKYSPVPPRHLPGFSRFIQAKSGGFWVRILNDTE